MQPTKNPRSLKLDGSELSLATPPAVIEKVLAQSNDNSTVNLTQI